ncbi:MAG TPA: hypothetical protein VFE62_25715, partial [Gemmataceae bacterium]|nr:hypothetical protein [Gemmataceae bacterium]
ITTEHPKIGVCWRIAHADIAVAVDRVAISATRDVGFSRRLGNSFGEGGGRVGHDIGAYLGDADPADPLEELEGWHELPGVAYLRRNSWDPLCHTLYEVLDVEEFAGSHSGKGIGRWFDRDDLEIGVAELLVRLAAGQDVRPEIDFLRASLAALPEGRASLFLGFG